MHTFVDGEPALGDGGADAEDNAPYDDDGDADDADVDSYPASSLWVIGHYRAECGACKASYVSEHREPIALRDEAAYGCGC